MAKNKLTPVEKIDPTLPYTEIEIEGITYKMCLDLGAIGEAEDRLAKTDPTISLLECSWNLKRIKNLRTIFAASLAVYHPDIPFEQAAALVKWENHGLVIVKVREAQQLFFPEPEKKEPDPPQAPGQ